ncbi:LOW QUALITY PROTEIN: hypothetical protein HZS_8058 [Henneguya salminicola]|nr:LOW QUALITY PROTEIN: hypothetical protein HZS_8058 [Henneguya salminicola]
MACDPYRNQGVLTLEKICNIKAIQVEKTPIRKIFLVEVPTFNGNYVIINYTHLFVQSSKPIGFAVNEKLKIDTAIKRNTIDGFWNVLKYQVDHKNIRHILLMKEKISLKTFLKNDAVEFKR